MTDIHNDYLKDEHLEDDEEEELNLHSQKGTSIWRQPTTETQKHQMNSWKLA